MRKQSAGWAAIILFGGTSIGCGNIELTGFNLNGFGGGVGGDICPAGTISAVCEHVILWPDVPQYVLLGDTASFFAHTLIGKADSIQWVAADKVISFAGRPAIEISAYVSNSHVTVHQRNRRER